MLQKDGAADFASNIFLKVFVCSNADFNLFAFDVKQKLSPGGMSVVLFAADILPKKPVWRLKTDTEKKAAFFYCMYAFANEEKGCL